MDPMQYVDFASDDIENAMAKLTPAEIDQLAFGAIQLRGDGTVLHFNAAEGEITGRDPAKMIGRNFFTDIAPCTNTPVFRAVFDQGVKTGLLNARLDYLFDHQMAPQRVKVHMKKAMVGNTYWIFVKRL